MIVMMRNSVKSYTLWTFLLASLAAGVTLVQVSSAATLNDFEINTDQNAVKVILHTDKRASYTTRREGACFVDI